LYLFTVTASVLAGLAALALVPLRTQWVGIALTLFALGIYFAQGVLALVIWGAKSFVTFRRGSLNRAVRRYRRSYSRRTWIIGSVLIVVAAAFAIFDAAIPSPERSTIWIGLAVAIFVSLVGADSLQLSVRRR
jgi:uncharacterized membrane protein